MPNEGSKFAITEDDIKFLVNLQREWTILIIGRMVANDEIEELEQAERQKLIAMVNQIRKMVNDIHLRLQDYLKKVQSAYSAMNDEEKRLTQDLLNTLMVTDQSLLQHQQYIETEIRNPFSVNIKETYQEAYQKLFELYNLNQLENIDQRIAKIKDIAQDNIKHLIEDTNNHVTQYVKETIYRDALIILEELEKFNTRRE